MKTLNINELLSNRELKDTQVFVKHTKLIPESVSRINKDIEKLLYKMQIIKCNGKYGEYKALKIILLIDGKFKEVSPWYVVDFKSQNLVEHMQEIKPMFVIFYQAEDLERTDEKGDPLVYNKVRILPYRTQEDINFALQGWEERQ